VPMEALTAEDGDKDPALQDMLARATSAANFLTPPSEWDDEEAMEDPIPTELAEPDPGDP
jgi:hypothetical protein